MPETYRSPYTGTMADLIRQRGEIAAQTTAAIGDAQARRAAQSGQAWGNAIQNIGNAVSGTLKDYTDYKANAPVREAQALQLQRAKQQYSAEEGQQFLAKAGQYSQHVQASNYNPDVAEPMFKDLATMHPEYTPHLQRALAEARAGNPTALKAVVDTFAQQAGVKGPDVVSVETIDEQGRPVTKMVPKQPGQSFLKPPEKVGTTTIQTVENGQPVTKIVPTTPGQSFPAPPPKTEQRPVERVSVLLDGKPQMVVFDPNGQGKYLFNGQDVSTRVRPLPTASETEKPSIWISKGDEMRFVTPSTAAQMSAQGWRSGNTREQGRPVTSGDAGKVSDFDSSLELLRQLAPQIKEPGSTGFGAQVGAWVPNAITQLTGWGADAKKQQAVINQVKQIIGKALEGGVLRKEDEVKYEKILPVIGDPTDVATAKLNGLWNTLLQKRQNTLDSLSDAGYDITRFNNRAVKPLESGGLVRMIAPNGQEQDVPADQVDHYKSLGAKVKG